MNLYRYRIADATRRRHPVHIRRVHRTMTRVALAPWTSRHRDRRNEASKRVRVLMSWPFSDGKRGIILPKRRKTGDTKIIEMN